MNVILTSCGLETKRIEKLFMDMLQKSPSETKAIFIPTAANSPDAIENNIINSYDVIYLCGGNPDYLLKRINENTFRKQLLEFISLGKIVIGVSAGSMIFANDIPDNLGLLKCGLDVHCNDEVREKAGHYVKERLERIKLGNTQAVYFEGEQLSSFCFLVSKF